jgi:hypothetical protein
VRYPMVNLEQFGRKIVCLGASRDLTEKTERRFLRALTQKPYTVDRGRSEGDESLWMPTGLEFGQWCAARGLYDRAVMFGFEGHGARTLVPATVVQHGLQVLAEDATSVILGLC